MTALVLRRAAVAPGCETDLVIEDGRLVAAPASADVDAVDLGGRPVIAGLADHHLHLLSLAAAWGSVDCSPAALAAAGGLARHLRAARRRQRGGWLRATGYDITATGPLDAARLEDIGVGPVRVQDRTGTFWVLDRRGLDEVLPDDRQGWPPGTEVDGAGRPTGVLARSDRWLGDRVPRTTPDLAGVGRWLAGRGVTSITDAGAGNGPDELAALAAADLPQRLCTMTRDADVALDPAVAARLVLGPVKILLDDADLPGLDALTARVDGAHRRGRAVAVHCVSEVQVVLALAAGIDRRDRIEHASLVPDGLLPALARAGPTVVVQPGLVWSRGDRYLEETDTADRAGLHRLWSFRKAGLRVAASSDAPYGPADPWTGVTAAVDRRTAAGQVLGGDERVSPEQALRLFQGDPADPATRRGLRAGDAADLVVLDDAWAQVGQTPAVAATLRAGQVIAGALPG